MLRIDAYPVESGFRLRIAGVCTGLQHGEDRCEGRSVQCVVSTADVEEYGAEWALAGAVQGMLREYPGLCERLYH